MFSRSRRQLTQVFTHHSTLPSAWGAVLLAGALVVSGCTGPGGDNAVGGTDTPRSMQPNELVNQTWINYTYAPVMAYEFIENPDAQKAFDIQIDGFAVRGEPPGEGSYTTISGFDLDTGETIDVVDTVSIFGMVTQHSFQRQGLAEVYDSLLPRGYNVGVPGSGSSLTMFELRQNDGVVIPLRTSTTRNPTAARFLRFVDLINPNYNPFNNISTDPNNQINPWLLEAAPVPLGATGESEGVWVETRGDGGAESFKIVPFTITQSDHYLIRFTWIAEAGSSLQRPADDQYGNVLVLDSAGKPYFWNGYPEFTIQGDEEFATNPANALPYANFNNAWAINAEFNDIVAGSGYFSAGTYYAFISNYTYAYDFFPDNLTMRNKLVIEPGFWFGQFTFQEQEARKVSFDG